MRIAFLCKRRYMRKDVILDRYARLYEIPRQLADRGDNVLGLCLDYRSRGCLDVVVPEVNGSLRWRSFDAGPLFGLGAMTYPVRVLNLLHEFKPDVVIGASDAPHIVLASWVASRLAVPLVVDLYDNFESFALTRRLCLVNLYRRSVARAHLVSCVSAPLADRVRFGYQAQGEVLTIRSTIDSHKFYARDKRSSRLDLGLPLDAKLVGTAGALCADRGIETVYAAFEALSKCRKDVHLVLAGSRDPKTRRLRHPRVHYLEELVHDKIPTLFSALDVGVIYLRPTEFGSYSFPQKAFEMLACGLPVVAARVGEMATLLEGKPSMLYQPDDSASMLACLERQLDNPVAWEGSIPTWTDLGATFGEALQHLVPDTFGQTAS